MSTDRNVCKVCLFSVIMLTSLSQTIHAGVEMNGTWHEKTAARERFCLNGEWDFHPLPGERNHHWFAPPELGEVDGYEWKMKLRVPGVWMGGDWYHEYQFLNPDDAVRLRGSLRAWYKRQFFVPAEWAGK